MRESEIYAGQMVAFTKRKQTYYGTVVSKLTVTRRIESFEENGKSVVSESSAVQWLVVYQLKSGETARNWWYSSDLIRVVVPA